MLPEMFLNRMRELLGEEYPAFLQSLEKERYQALRMNPLKGSSCQPFPFFMTKVSWEENGYYYGEQDQPGKHPYHEAGVYYIQEPSAMAVAPLLQVKPGERVLDLCAAPGGKSTQIAAGLRGEGLLVCNEIHPARAKILSENIERMGIVNACVVNEDPERLSERFPAYFDKILVDAPCSGEGMFRKNEAACGEWSIENVKLCAARQDGILDQAAKMLRPGGRLVYSTCTFAPEEDEGSISRFLNRHPEFALLPIDKQAMGLPEGLCDGRPQWAEYGADTEKVERTDAEKVEQTDAENGNGEALSAKNDLTYTLRLWPQHVKGEGHFAAVLQKKGNGSERTGMAAPVGGLERGMRGDERELETWREFWECIAICGHAVDRNAVEESGRALEGEPVAARLVRGTDRFLRFGEQLYLMPEQMPSLKGLRVLRPGLHLGTWKKNRFEPSHALALALSPKEVRHVCHFSATDPVLAAYLNGQTFSYGNGEEKGWYLIAADGCSIGWGKLAGGMMKNHYPKGLRKG